MAGRVKKNPHQKAREILANCVEKFDGCLIWQGQVSERGYGMTQFAGKHVMAHRIVALYGVERSDEQVEALKSFRIDWKCGHTICMRLDGNHMHFSTSKPKKEYESLPSLDEMARNLGIEL